MSRFMPLVLFVALAAFLVFGLNRDPSVVPSPLIGKPAPRFQLPELRDPTVLVGTDDWIGTPYLLNVWATWCEYCKFEHPLLMYIAATHDIPIHGLNYKDESAAALQWLEDFGDPYADIAFDADGKVAIDFGVYGAPETYVIDGGGQIVHKVIGPLTDDIWRSEVLPVVEQLRAGS